MPHTVGHHPLATQVFDDPRNREDFTARCIWTFPSDRGQIVLNPFFGRKEIVKKDCHTRGDLWDREAGGWLIWRTLLNIFARWLQCF
jgi:hypothetical protein